MTVFSMYWQRTLKKPGIVWLWLSLPFVFMTIYALVFGSSGTIQPAGLVIIDRDSSFVSELFKRSFSAGQLRKLVSVIDADGLGDAEGLFARDDASAALLIPKGFGKDLLLRKNIELCLYTNPRHHYNPQILKGITETVTTIANEFLRFFEEPFQSIASFMEDEKEPDADEVGELSRTFYEKSRGLSSLASLGSLNVKVVEKKGREIKQTNMASYFFPGLVVFALLSLSMGIEGRFLTDRLNRLNNRLAASPKSRISLVMSQRLYSITFLYVASVVCAVLGGIVWGIPPAGLFQINLMTIGVIFFIVGLNASIFSLAKTMKSASALSSLILTFLIILGGCVMPVEVFPASIQKISRLTPTGLANTGIVQSLTGREVTISIPFLIAYGGAFLAFSIVAGRRRTLQQG